MESADVRIGMDFSIEVTKDVCISTTRTTEPEQFTTDF